MDKPTPTGTLGHPGNEYAAKLAAQARTPKEFQVDPKVYFHHHNYAKFHFDLGQSAVKTVSFANNRYITDDKREQDQLDLVCDFPGTFIYSLPDSDVRAAMEQERDIEKQKAVMQTAVAVAGVHNQIVDPNTPIVPVKVEQVSSNQQGTTIRPAMQQQGTQQPRPTQAPAVVGLQSTATNTTGAPVTSMPQQSRAPSSESIAAASARTLAAEIDKKA